MTSASEPQWPIFIISLSDAFDRRATICAALEARNLKYEICEAIDGRQGLNAALEAHIDRDGTPAVYGRPMSDTEYACALSHMSVYERILERDLPGAVVFEDDAILTSHFDEFIEARGYLRADLVQLDHLNGDVWLFDRPLPLTAEISLARAARNAALATGYTISASGARYFLEEGRPIRSVADWPADPTKIGVLLCLPRAVDHPPFSSGSAIEADRARLQASVRGGPRILRFFRAAYWKRWWFTRRTKRVS